LSSVLFRNASCEELTQNKCFQGAQGALGSTISNSVGDGAPEGDGALLLDLVIMGSALCDINQIAPIKLL
jgi:hypothetical protein